MSCLKRKSGWAILLIGMILAPSVFLAAQSDDNSVPLGDIARALRKKKDPEAPATPTVIDNDNLSQVMDQAEKDRQKGDVKFAFDGIGKDLHVSSPDVTCNLSFNAESGALLNDPFAVQDVPRTELAKLDGPAVVQGDALQVTVYNGTGWTIKEITVGLTIARRADPGATAQFGAAKLVPAAAADEPAGEKRSDLTVLYHLKGYAAPSSTTVFRQSLGGSIASDQDWHWAIVQAQGIPPK
jgi:hypothetical protein